MLVQAKQMTCIQGETFEFCVRTKDKEAAYKLSVKCGGDEVKPIRIDEESLKNDTQSVVSVWYQYPAEVEGAYRSYAFKLSIHWVSSG